MAYSKNTLENRKSIFEIEKETRLKALEWLKKQKEKENGKVIHVDRNVRTVRGKIN